MLETITGAEIFDLQVGRKTCEFLPTCFVFFVGSTRNFCSTSLPVMPISCQKIAKQTGAFLRPFECF
jgi:hypothetical protein